MNDLKELGILILGHGSRELASVQEFESLVSLYRQRWPHLEIRLAHIELVQPDVKTALVDFAKTHQKILLLPLFLFTSGHIKNDLPLIIHELKPRFPFHEFIAADAIGVEPRMIQILMDRITELYERTGSPENNPTGISPETSFAEFSIPTTQHRKKSGVIVVGRGSSDVDANGDFHKVVRFFEEANHYAFVLPTFVGITRPLLPETLDFAAKLRPEQLIIVPYFLFKGRLIQRIEKLIGEFHTNYPWIHTEISAHIGFHPEIFSILDERVERATRGKLPLPCITCEYRQQLPGLPNKVGGLSALLWSLRHLETHTQAGPHEFPHKNLKKHVLVCENVDCASKGSMALVSKMRNLIKSYGKQTDFRITRTSCMGRCGEGPAVVIYPDGVWYRKVQVEDADALVNEHLMRDRIVSRLVDNIMQ